MQTGEEMFKRIETQIWRERGREREIEGEHEEEMRLGPRVSWK